MKRDPFEAYAEALADHQQRIRELRETRKLRVRAAVGLNAKVALELEYAECERIMRASRPTLREFKAAAIEAASASQASGRSDCCPMPEVDGMSVHTPECPQAVERPPRRWVVYSIAPIPAWNGDTLGASSGPDGRYVAHHDCARSAGYVKSDGCTVKGYASDRLWGEPRPCAECGEPVQ